MNENNENNEKNNQIPSNDESSDTQAFKWEYENTSAEDAPVENSPVDETQTEGAPVEEASVEGISTEKTSAEETSIEKAPIEEAPIEEAPPAEKTEQDIKKEKRKAKAKRRHTTKALIRESTVATVLSACSVVLLVALTVLLMLGIIPTDSRVVFVQVSNLGPVGTVAGDASPEIIEDFKNSVVIITVKTSSGGATGSGIIITEDGYIATNYHVVEDAKDIEITLYNSEKAVPARLVGYSERDDIAVVKANLEDLRPATFARSEDCRVGERVYSVGAPEGAAFGWTVTQGIISSTRREIKIYDSEYILEKKMFLLQTDAAVNPGNSGGPLINARGEVVGIVTLKRTDTSGMGFALPSTGALELIEAIIENGNIEGVKSQISSGRPLIGIVGVGIEADVWYEDIGTNLRQVDKNYAEFHSDTCFISDVAGVYVTSMNPDLDASNHLMVGDVIISVNGTPVYITYDIMDIVNELNGGDTVKVEYARDGKTYTVDITLGEEK